MRRLLQRLRPRNIWNRFVFRAVDFSDNEEAFRTAYIVPDPHNLKSAQAAYRFARTNQIIQENFGRVHRLLEIGCAEGRQSQHLMQLCDTLHGIDVSPRALSRARERCPTCQFSCENIFSIRESFDLVVAAEVLYYMSDIPAVINHMNTVGSHCLITYYEPYADRLDRYFADIPGARGEVLQYKNTRWKAVWWKSGPQ